MTKESQTTRAATPEVAAAPEVAATPSAVVAPNAAASPEAVALPKPVATPKATASPRAAPDTPVQHPAQHPAPSAAPQADPTPAPAPTPTPAEPAPAVPSCGDPGLDIISAFLAQSAAEEAQQQQQAALAAQQEEEEAARHQQQQQTPYEAWHGNPSHFTAEQMEPMRLPGCEYRATAVCVGLPNAAWFEARAREAEAAGTRRARWVVHAVRDAADQNGVVFRAAETGSTAQEVETAREIAFGDVNLNCYFEGLGEQVSFADFTLFCYTLCSSFVYMRGLDLIIQALKSPSILSFIL